MHTRCVIVLHHNSPPRDYSVQNILDYLCWRGLHHLPYRPGLSPFDFHVFDPLKRAPMGRMLQPEEYEAEAKKKCEQFICVYFPSQYNTMVLNPILTPLLSCDILVFFLSKVFTVSRRRRKLQKPVLFRFPCLHCSYDR